MRLSLVFGAVSVSGAELPSGPSTTVPADLEAPGDYPNFTVTGVNWEMDASEVMGFNDPFTMNEVKFDIKGQGPLPWSLTSFGRGVFGPMLNVANPDSVTPVLGDTPFDLVFDGSSRYEFESDRRPEWPNSGAAWRPDPSKGMLLGSIRKNGQLWDDGEPMFYGTLSFAVGPSGHAGYDMETGDFISLTGEAFHMTTDRLVVAPVVSKAGPGIQSHIDNSMAWFPFDQGWTGGYVESVDTESGEWVQAGLHSAGLPADASQVVTWRPLPGASAFFGSPAKVRLPSVDTDDGMLFTSPLPTNQAIDAGIQGTRISAADPLDDKSGWLVWIRDNNSADEEEALENGVSFSFLYIPYDSVNLVGARIRGSDGSVIKGGNGGFTLNRLGTGRYEVSIPNEGAQDGMLLLGTTGKFSNNASVVSPAFLSYEPNDSDGFVIESRYVAAQDSFPLVDSDFYFAWVDFSRPLSPPGSDPGADVPSIQTEPQAQEINEGQSVSFTVVAVGAEPLSYQWQKNLVDINGATSATFTIDNVQDSDAGSYRVQVTNSGGSVFSNAAKLTVLPPITPPMITQQPQSQTKSIGESATFSVVATGVEPLTYQWTFEGANIAGATASSLTKNNIQISDAGDYQVIISNQGGDRVSAIVELTVLATVAPPDITLQPQSAMIDVGDNVSFTVVATGSQPISYQWQKNGANINGATQALYTITSAQENDAGNYQVVVANEGGSKTSQVAVLTVEPPVVGPGPAITQHPQSRTVVVGGSVTFEVVATGSGSLTYQWWFTTGGDQIPIIGQSTSTLVVGDVRESFAGEYFVVVSDALGDTTSNRATLMVSETPILEIIEHPQSQTVPVGSAVTFEVVATGNGILEYEWYFNGTILPGQNGSSLAIAQVKVNEGGDYHVIVRDSEGELTSETATLTVVSAPVIITQPQSQTVGSGVTVVFAVEAIGVEPLAYQWSFNGNPLLFQESSTLTIPNVQGFHQGDYTVEVTNEHGADTSDPATLTIRDEPLEITGTSIVGGQLVVEWAGGTGIVLEFKARLSDSFWAEVPGTDGQSSYAQDVGGTASGFYRLRQR